MKTLSSLFGFLLFANVLFAQINADSLQQKVDNIQLPEMPDSLKTSWLKVDSIRNEFNDSADSIQTKFRSSIGAIETEQSKIQHKIDSLEKLSMPSTKFTRKLDSLTQKKKDIENDFNDQANSLKSKTIGKLDKVEMTPELQQQIGGLTGQVNGFNPMNNDFAKVPAVQMPGYKLPKVDGLTGDKLGGLGNLSGIQTPLGDLGGIPKQAGALGQDVKNIASGNLSEVKSVPQAIEQQALKVDGMQELQKSSQALEGYKEQLGTLNSAEGAKTQGANMVKKEAINHFAGKEKELQAAMDKLSKYKQKYSSVQSIKNLPKRPPNAMKGKPFIERLVPGVWMQFQIKNAWLIDVNPYAGYKISGRFTSGIGWNQRLGYEKKFAHPLPDTRIWGPRAFLDFRLGRGFIGHLEQEVMNAFVPINLSSNPNEGKREWVWSTMLGMKKQYKIYKNLNGTVLIQYNLFNPYFKAPYLDRLNSRMGFEYLLRKKKSDGKKGKQ